MRAGKRRLAIERPGLLPYDPATATFTAAPLTLKHLLPLHGQRHRVPRSENDTKRFRKLARNDIGGSLCSRRLRHSAMGNMRA